MKKDIIRKTAPAFYANIYVAGDISEAKRICASYCMIGLCVTVSETEFIYTGGRESGLVVGLVNYPRFPTTPEDIQSNAELLGVLLITEMHQYSALIQTPNDAIWLTRRPNEQTSVSSSDTPEE